MILTIKILTIALIGFTTWWITIFMLINMGPADPAGMSIFLSPIIFFVIPLFIKKINTSQIQAMWILATAPIWGFSNVLLSVAILLQFNDGYTSIAHTISLSTPISIWLIPKCLSVFNRSRSKS